MSDTRGVRARSPQDEPEHSERARATRPTGARSAARRERVVRGTNRRNHGFAESWSVARERDREQSATSLLRAAGEVNESPLSASGTGECPALPAVGSRSRRAPAQVRWRRSGTRGVVKRQTRCRSAGMLLATRRRSPVGAGERPPGGGVRFDGRESRGRPRANAPFLSPAHDPPGSPRSVGIQPDRDRFPGEELRSGYEAGIVIPYGYSE